MKKANVLKRIASSYMQITTLETRQSDRLDIHEVKGNNLLCAMVEAYRVGNELWFNAGDDVKLHKYACKLLNRETLEIRGAYELDYFNIAVWDVKKLLEYAYDCGKKTANKRNNSIANAENN